MEFNKKVTVSLSLATMVSLLAGCSFGNAPLSPDTKTNIVSLKQEAKVNKVYIADVGNGQKTPASISFKINLSDLKGFTTKASTAGTAAKTKDDLTNLKFYLIESTTGSAPTALDGSGFTYTVSADNKTNNRVDITFTNVAANNPDMSYYIAVAGFSSNTYTAVNNITNLNAPINDSTEGKYFVSTGGGSPAGAVRVTPTTYALSGTAALAIPLKLLDAVSPVIDSDVNITSGSEITGGPSGSGN